MFKSLWNDLFLYGTTPLITDAILVCAILFSIPAWSSWLAFITHVLVRLALYNNPKTSPHLPYNHDMCPEYRQ